MPATAIHKFGYTSGTIWAWAMALSGFTTLWWLDLETAYHQLSIGLLVATTSLLIIFLLAEAVESAIILLLSLRGRDGQS